MGIAIIGFLIPLKDRLLWRDGVFCLCLLSWVMHCGSHGDKREIVSVWETLMSRVEGMP